MPDPAPWPYLDHRCPLCGAFYPAGIYSHGAFADHMILAHGKYPPACDEDCVGCVSNRRQEVHRA